MTTTVETLVTSPFVDSGAGDQTSQQRLAREAERDHRERLAAVRVVAGLAADADEARELYAMLGLTETEAREAREACEPRGAVVTGLAPAVAPAPARRGRVSAA